MKNRQAHGSRGATVLALTGLLLLSACKTVTGHVWLPVYASNDEALGEVDLHFTADCQSSTEDGTPVEMKYIDTVENIRFDGELVAPPCQDFDPLYGIYGTLQGVYHPSADWQGLGRERPGRFELEFIDVGEPGYSQGDYVCLRLAGGTFANYALPAFDDVDDDGMKDEGCSFIGGGKIQINLGETTW